MNVMAYLLTLMNIHDFETSGGPIQDLSVKMADMVTIANYLSHEHIFAIDDFKGSGYCRKYNVGRYISKNARDYIHYRNVSDTEEGIILTIFFNTDKPGRHNALPDSPTRETLTYFIHKNNDPELRGTVEEYLNTKI